MHVHKVIPFVFACLLLQQAMWHKTVEHSGSFFVDMCALQKCRFYLGKTVLFENILVQGDYDGDDADDVGDGGLEDDQLHDPHRGLVRHGVDLRDT